MATTVNTFVEFKNNLSMMVKQVVADFDKENIIKARTTINIYNSKITVSLSSCNNPSQRDYIYIYFYNTPESKYPETMCEVFNKVYGFINHINIDK